MVRTRVFAAAGLLLVLGSAGETRQSVARITAPRQQFGASIGDDYFLATFAQLDAYWKQLDRESDRVTVVDIGPTTEGRRQPMAIVTAPENARALDRYKEISRRLARAEGLSEEQARALAAEGKAVVVIAGGLHADETLGAQQLVETVYQLATRDDAETMRVLRDTIVLAIHANPDGHELVANWYMREADPQKRSLARLPRLFHKYAGHDNNRDFYMASQAETVNINHVLYQEWFPQIVYDHHQSGPAGSVMFAPPFRGPVNPNIDPVIIDGIARVADAMHERLAAEGKRGIVSGEDATYSAWWNGGLRTTPYFHNQIGILTETIGSPTPMTNPLAPQPWRFRQSIDYSLTANRAVLDYASRDRQALLLNAYRMGRASIDRGGRGVRAYVLPADQPDFPTAAKFVTALLHNGVVVHRATRAFTAAGMTYPAGSFVVRTAQAFRPHVVDMFEPQDHPDDIVEGGDAPEAPYDNAGWTLALQMGVTFDRVREPLDGPFEIVSGIARPPAGRVDSGRYAGYLVSHAANDVFVVVNRLLKAGERVSWPDSNSVYVTARASTRPILEQASRELGLTFTGVATPPTGEAWQLQPVRIALADKPGGSVPGGWTRWVLERFEFPFDVVQVDDLAERDLRRYDVIILPEDVVSDRRTAMRLTRFVEDGGSLIAVGRATGVATAFDLPLSNPLAGLPRSKYFIPGSVLRMRVDTSIPPAFGFEPDVDVFFDNSPVFRLEPGATGRGVRPIAWFASPMPLRSGWARGQSQLKDTVAAVEASVGRGHLFLFGPPVTFRAQSHGTFKLLFNSIYYGSATRARLH